MRYEIDNALGYHVCLTDLTYLWTEELDEDAVLRKARSEQTSIDPSLGRDQLQLLYRKLTDALDGKDDTTMSVYSDDQSLQLFLQVTAVLPSGLKPLTWTFGLTRTSQEKFGSLFCQNILSNLASATVSVDFLLRQIAEKDRVIEKLCGKLEDLGLGIDSVFLPPQPARGRRAAATRASVPGLERLNQQEWNAKWPSTFDKTSLHTFHRNGLDSSNWPGQPLSRSWQTKIRSTDETEERSGEHQAPAPDVGRNLTQSRNRQEKSNSPLPNDEDSTTDESDINDTARSERGDETAHLQLDATDASSLRPKLGRIGGRRTPPAPRERSRKRPSPSSPRLSLASTAHSPSRSSGPSPNKQRSTPPIISQSEQTEQERADLNRAKLKQKLDEKRKVPAKKKRKF